MKNSITHDFYCTQCGTKGIPLYRANHTRERGHLKKLYCLSCGCQTNHAECIEGSKYDYEAFLLEFNSGNFDENGKRVLSLSEQKRLNYQYIPEEENVSNEPIDIWYELFDMKPARAG